MRLVRLPLAGLALLACAWFALGIRQARDTGRATAIVGAARATPSQLDRAGSLIGSARTLNPDRTLDLLDLQLALRQGRPAVARRLALALVRAEPMNVAAWLWYGRASGGDPGAFLISLAHARELDPLPLKRGGRL